MLCARDLSRHRETSEVMIMEGGITQHYKLYENQIRSVSSIRDPNLSTPYVTPWFSHKDNLTKASLWGFLASKQKWCLYLVFLTKHSNVLNPFNATFFHCPASLTCTTVSKTPPSFTQEKREYHSGRKQTTVRFWKRSLLLDHREKNTCWCFLEKFEP